MPTKQLVIGDLVVEVARKSVKNLNLRVCAPDGQVRVSAPLGCGDDAIRAMVLARLDWIHRHQEQVIARAPAGGLTYDTGELHYYLGRPYPLAVITEAGPEGAALRDGHILLRVRPGSDAAWRQAVLEWWYRIRLQAIVPPLMDRWQAATGLYAAEWRIKRMRTRWGTCSLGAKRVWLNQDLIRWPQRCLEYIILHELAHLQERYHDARFRALLDRHMPDWRDVLAELNRGLPPAGDGQSAR